jgi:putative ABC transport system permease protein
MISRRLRWTLHTLLSHYRHHPLQTLFLLTGLITGVALWVAVQVINTHARSSYQQATELLGAQATHWIRPAGDSGIEPELYIELRRAGFRQLYPVLEEQLTTRDRQPLNLIATDLLALPIDSAGAFNATANWSELMQPPFRAWYPQSLADALDIQPGEQLALASGILLPAAVIQTQAQQGQRVFMDIGAAMTVLGRSRFSYLAVSGLTPVEEAALSSALPAQWQLVTNQQSLDLSELTESLHSNLTAMSLLSFAVGLFIVFNAVRFSLNARSTTLATLQELGVSVRLLSTAIAFETLLLSIIGAAAGIALGYLLGQQLLPAVATSVQNLYGAVIDHRLLLQPLTILKAWGMTLAGLVFALGWPLWKRSQRALASQRSISDDWLQDRKARLTLALGALVLLALALLLYPNMDSVAQGFTLLALLLFAAAWLLPLLLAAVLTALQMVIPEQAWRWRWAVTDGWTQLPVLRTALMALLLALTANFGVDTLVGSFRTALENWLDQRIAADIYINSENLQSDSILQSSLIRDHHQRIGVDLRWGQRPTQVYGLDTRAPDSLQLPLAMRTEALAAWYRNEAGVVLANEQLHHLAGIDAGDQVTLTTPSGPRKFTVAGFFYDYGNPFYRFYLPYDIVERLWPDAGNRGLALWFGHSTPAGGADISRSTRTAIEQKLLQAGAQAGEWIYRDDILQVSIEIFDRTFAITAAMSTLTLIVAAIALLASLLSIHQQRLPEYAHWRAMGVRRREWLFIVLLPLAICILLTWLLSLPLGTLLAWLLIHDLNVLSFGWTMPMLVQSWPALRLALLTAVVVAITLIITVLQVRYRLSTTLKQLGGDA